MSIKQKILIPVLLALVLTAGLLTALNVASQNTLIENQEQQNLTQLGGILTDDIAARAQMSAALASSIADIPEVQKAFADRDRQALLSMLLPAYQELAKSYGVSQGQFHLAPATSFLRLHQPDKFGDDLSSFRATVVAANKEKRPIVGLEEGKAGYGIRGVVPVDYQGQQVGSFEIGMDFDKEFLQQIKQSYGADISIYLQEEGTKVQTFQQDAGKTSASTSAFTLYASTMDKPLNVADSVRLQVFKSGQPAITRSSQGDTSYATISLPIRDYTNAVVGLAEISVKRDAAIAQVNSSRNVALGIGLGLLLLMGLILWLTTTRFVVRPLQTMARVAAAVSAGDVNQEVRVNSRDEIGQLACALRDIVTYLKSMVDMAKRLADGDLTAQVQARGDDDQLSNAVAQMVSGLRKLVGELRTTSVDLDGNAQQLDTAASQSGAAVQQVTTTIQHIAQGAQRQSEVAHNVSESVLQLNQTIGQVASGAKKQVTSVETAGETAHQMVVGIQQVAASADQVARESQQTRELALQGSQMVQDAMSGIASLKETVHRAAAQIDALGQASEQINSVVETIDDIAEQTNLLALNAAIEAARAGEHGRGFAVVAEEVRKLAERSSRETRQIADLVRSVQAGTQSAVDAMHGGAQEAETGADLASRAGDALREIVQSVEDTVDRVAGIARAAQEMSTSSRGVTGALESISAVAEQTQTAAGRMEVLAEQLAAAVDAAASTSEENSAATEEVSASAEEMSSQVEEMSAQAEELARTAGQLRSMVAQFQLE